MVLQQQSKAVLWGWAEPAEKIYITNTWNKSIDSVVTGSDAKWKIAIATPTAGGPYSITLRGWSTVVIENVMIGEVWVCSGQSNMEWNSYNNLKQILDEMPNSNNNNLRLFHIPRTTAAYPQDNCEGQWKTSSPESLKGFSAIGYFFAKRLQKELNVPVGIISTSWGGTPAETWTSEEDVESDEILRESAAQIKPTAWWPVNPGAAFNAMIYPITNYNIAGAIWYQGEGNTGTASNYNRILTTMIDCWRKAWHRNLPFYYVQIAPFKYGNKNVGALVQEQQTMTLKHPNTGMVVITDLVDDTTNIHPNNKIPVADRLANWALGDLYHKQVVYKSPLFKSMVINKDKVTVSFDNVPTSLMVKGKGKPTEFYLAGEDQVFYPADAKIDKDKIIVSSKLVKNPVAVRFAFSNTAISNLFSTEGLPVTPFRTDTWPVSTEKTP